MPVYATLDIKIETVSTGYHLTVDNWFVGAFKTVSALQDKVAEIIAQRTH